MTQVWGGLAGLLVSYMDDNGLGLADLRRTLADYDPSRRMPIGLWCSALGRIALAQRTCAVGLRIGEYINAHHLGLLGYLFSTARTLGDALHCFQRFQPLLHDAGPLSIRRRAGEVCVAWNAVVGERTQLSDEVLLSCLLNFSRRMTRCDGLAFSRVGFPSPMAGAGKTYEALLGCEVAFDSGKLFACFADELLAHSVRGSDPNLFGLLQSLLEEKLTSLSVADDFVSNLQRQVESNLLEGNLAFEELAGRMGMTERTLQRRLKERGLSYRSLLDDVRFHLAQLYLNEGSMPLAEISMVLGYSEQSAFTRAFKRWSGQTPFRYRCPR